MTETYSASADNVAISLAGVTFKWPRQPEPVLDIATLQIKQGERVFISGPSGSGKTTLLNLLAGVTVPEFGRLQILDRCTTNMNGASRDRFRAQHIGLIFQLFNLIAYLSVVENVVLPCWFAPARLAKAQKRSGTVENEALRLLGHLGLDDPDLLKRPVTALSVGQQQRVAAARALIGEPEIAIADEPTSSLDADLREAFIQLLFAECDRQKTTLVFVSHDRALAELFDRSISLPDINRARPAKG
ncbi:MAG: ABC transporter ATP-binding protein [Cyanobacteria bacterium P01_D01_bin.123]